MYSVTIYYSTVILHHQLYQTLEDITHPIKVPENWRLIFTDEVKNRWIYKRKSNSQQTHKRGIYMLIKVVN